jgi:tellurite resistance protein
MPSPPDDQGHGAALGRVVRVLAEDAIFVLASFGRDTREALEGLLPRRAPAYVAALKGQPYTQMTGAFDGWFVEMVRALAPVAPPVWVPMMEIVREKITLEIGARGLRSFFSSKPSEKDVSRVRRYGSLAVRVLRAVLAADGPLDTEERTTVAALIAALGLPEADARALGSEGAHSGEAIDVYGELDHAVCSAVVRGAWLAAAADGIDPREEHSIRTVTGRMGLASDEVEDARREAQERVEARQAAGAAAVDGVRYVLADRCPGLGVQLAARTGTLVLPRRWRDETLAAVAQGAPVALAKRHTALAPGARQAALGIAWAAALADDPAVGRRALLRSRWERLAEDLGEDDPSPREHVERWMDEAVIGVARTLG